MLQPLEDDPVACHRRNVHGRSLSDIQALAAKWEAVPPLYTQLDVASLFRAATGAQRGVRGTWGRVLSAKWEAVILLNM